MEKLKLVESFDDMPSVSLVEGNITEASKTKASRVDGVYIIGMIEGQFFKPDGMSRNERFYPAALWEKAINCADVKTRCQNSLMFGEIGHSDGPVEDMTLRSGTVSHFIDELWVTPKNEGMGRAYILNTPAGQLLKTYLGAGCKLKVSSRGEGSYCESYTHDGKPVIDPDTYVLQTFDFVLNPGFLETSALLREQYEKVINDKPNLQAIKETIAHVTKEGEMPMTLDVNSYVQELKDERDALKAKIESLNEELKVKDRELLESKLNTDAQVQKLTEEFKPYKDLKVSAPQLIEAFNKGQQSIKRMKKDNQKLSEELKQYKDYAGSIEELKEATQLSNKALSVVSAYKKLGSAKELAELKESSAQLSEKYNSVVEELENYKKEVGSLEDLQKSKEITSNALDFIKEYKPLGEAEDIKKLYDYANKMKDMIKEAKQLEKLSQKAAVLLEQYKNIGTVEEIKQLKELAEKLVTSKNAKLTESVEPTKKAKVSLAEAKEFAKQQNCTIEEAAKLINKHGKEEAAKLIESKKSESDKPLVEGMEDSVKIFDEAKDKVEATQPTKTAKDYLTKGMIVNGFNAEAFGKPIGPVDINKVGSDDPKKENAATALLKKFGVIKPQTQELKVDVKPVTPEQADKAVKQLLK